jgi:hypothetical protein
MSIVSNHLPHVIAEANGSAGPCCPECQAQDETAARWAAEAAAVTILPASPPRTRRSAWTVLHYDGDRDAAFQVAARSGTPALNFYSLGNEATVYLDCRQLEAIRLAIDAFLRTHRQQPMTPRPAPF